MGDYFSIRGNEYHVPFADRCLDNKAYRSYFIHKTYQSAAVSYTHLTLPTKA